ncbi:hypothetical protein MTO96_027541 [Rhipicephalus appendiculatus]
MAEEISQDEASSSGWMTAYGRKNSKGMRAATTTHERNPTLGGRNDGGRAAASRSAYQSIVATSRLPQLPRDTYRIIVRPRDGLNVPKVSQIRFEQALPIGGGPASSRSCRGHHLSQWQSKHLCGVYSSREECVRLRKRTASPTGRVHVPGLCVPGYPR